MSELRKRSAISIAQELLLPLGCSSDRCIFGDTPGNPDSCSCTFGGQAGSEVSVQLRNAARVISDLQLRLDVAKKSFTLSTPERIPGSEDWPKLSKEEEQIRRERLSPTPILDDDDDEDA